MKYNATLKLDWQNILEDGTLMVSLLIMLQIEKICNGACLLKHLSMWLTIYKLPFPYFIMSCRYKSGAELVLYT